MNVTFYNNGGRICCYFAYAGAQGRECSFQRLDQQIQIVLVEL